jgi:hypothetical protein
MPLRRGRHADLGQDIVSSELLLGCPKVKGCDMADQCPIAQGPIHQGYRRFVMLVDLICGLLNQMEGIGAQDGNQGWVTWTHE